MARTMIQNVICLTALLALAFVAAAEGRPQNSIETEDTDEMEPQMAEVRRAYYDFPPQAMYQSLPLEKLQMLIGQIRPSAFLQSGGRATLDELYRSPNAKRQVRYRQCYFNPISCFKK